MGFKKLRYYIVPRRNKKSSALKLWHFGASLSIAAVFSLSMYAMIFVQNFSYSEVASDPGLEIYKYETETIDVFDSKAEFDAEAYSTGSFEVGQGDLLAVAAADDFVGLNHYGDNPPDTSTIDWWDDDTSSATKYNWRYRKCFEIDHTASASTETEYQIYLELDTASLVSAGKMESTGADIRFLDSDENVLDHYIADDMNTADTRIWVQMDNIDAGTTEDICMYYGYVPGSATDLSDWENVFTYTTQQDLYFVLADTADGAFTGFASYTDLNDIAVDAYNDQLDQFEYDFYPTTAEPVDQTTIISTTDPINGGYGNVNGTDNLVPASAAGTSFVYRIDRQTNAFSFASPWCDADVEVRNSLDNIVTGGSFTVNQGTVYDLTTTDNATTGIPNDDVVIVEVTNSCPILATHHTTTNNDTFVMYPAANEWYGVGSGRLEIAFIEDTTTVTLYRSDGTTVGPTVYNRGDEISINDAGSEGSEPAHRVVADKPIGVKSIADSDGAESTTFLPVNEMGYTYYIPDDMQYIAISTLEGVSTTVDLYNDGTNCGVGVPDDTATVSPAASFPGKVYFGSTTDGTNISAGACIVANNPIFAYYEYSNTNDERNLWNYKQNRQYVYPEPSYVTGSTEVGIWDLGSGTHEWTRRIEVTITNNYSSSISQYQVPIDLSGLTDVINLAQVDGGDIRAAGSTGDGTDNELYYLDMYDSTAGTGTLWFQTNVIAPAASESFYIYFRAIDEFDILNQSPEVWFDGMDMDGDGITGNNPTGTLQTWEDKSGNDNDATQATPANRPAINGNIVEFTGSAGDNTVGEYFDLPGVDIQTIFTVVDNTTDGSGGPIYDGGHAILGQPFTGTYVYLFISTNEFGYQVSFDGQSTDQGRIQLNNGALTSFGANVGTGNFPSTQTVLYAEYQTAQTNWIYLGALDWPTGTSEFRPNYDLKEFVGIDGTVSAADRSDFNNYLADKWGTGQATTTLTTTGDLVDMFTTNFPKPNYYVVDLVSDDEILYVISFADGNNISDGEQNQIVNEGEIVTLLFLNGVEQDDFYSVTGPLSIAFDSDSTEAAAPLAFAGTEFSRYVNRDTDFFSYYSPYATATVQLQQGSGSGWTTVDTTVVAAGTLANVSQDMTNNASFRIISDEPILAFHRTNNGDTDLLYPNEKTLDEGSGSYEIWGVPSTSMLLSTSSNTSVNATIYRSDGTSTNVTLSTANNFGFAQGGLGSQGDALSFHIVADGPIAAHGQADSDGLESVAFWPQREFSDVYVLPAPAQYMAVATIDQSVTCRVYDDLGVEVTTGPAAMDNVPPQTSGAQSDPFPNDLHIGGNDTGDGVLFPEGYRMECTEPVYAYFEYHVDTAKTDETSWLTVPQGRKRAYVEPVVEDLDSVNEEGLYYESGFDSATTALDPEGYIDIIVDGTTLTNGEHVFWNQVDWTEVISDRTDENSVDGVEIETAYGAPSPDCASATYTTASPAEVLLSSSVDTAPPFSDETTRDLYAQIPDDHSDNQCLRVRFYVRTGDEAYTPRINDVQISYYDPVLLEDQLNNPTITINGNNGTTYGSDRVRVAKITTVNSGLSGSLAELIYNGVSNAGVFTNADFEFLEIPTSITNPQFNFPPFAPSPPTFSASPSPFDDNNSVGIYFDHERTGASTETIDMEIDIDIGSYGGPFIRREFALEVGGV